MSSSLLPLRQLLGNSSCLRGWNRGLRKLPVIVLPSREQKNASSIAQSALKRKVNFWSAAEVEKLRQLSAEGKSVKDIALSLGRSAIAVVTKRYTDKSDGDKISAGSLASRPYWTESEVSKLVEARKQGLSFKQIAEMLGKSYGSTERKMYSPGLRVSRPGRPSSPQPKRAVTKRKLWTSEEVEQLDQLVRQKASVREIATAMRRSLGSVRCRMHKGGSTVKSFTKEEDAKLTWFLENGSKWHAVQASFPSRSLGSLRYRAATLGLAKGRLGTIAWSDEMLATLTRLRAEGKSFREISQHLPGRTAGACRAKLLELHTPFPRRKAV